jgi:Tfp pilus assembly protein PilO
MAKINFEWNKGTIAMTAGATAGVLLFFLLVMPLWAKAGRLAGEVKALESEMTAVREALDRSKTIKRGADFVSRNEVSRAIDEMAKIGTAMNINFIATSPQKIERPEGADHAVLPIRMHIQSEYKDMGAFLGALEHLEKSLVTVREFAIRGEPAVLPRLTSEIIVEIHLKDEGS